MLDPSISQATLAYQWKTFREVSRLNDRVKDDATMAFLETIFYAGANAMQKIAFHEGQYCPADHLIALVELQMVRDQVASGARPI